MSPEAWLPEVCALAETAGARILEIYRDGFSVSTKPDTSPVTDADRAASDLILTGLAHLTPGLPALSEEGEIPGYAQRRAWARYWLIDPLDGTREFIRRNGEFTVNIALIDGHRPLLGVVHAPALATTWYAGPGGAYRRRAGETVALRTRTLGLGITALVSRSHRARGDQALLARLPGPRAVPLGSSLKFCRIAEGEADLHPRFGPTSEWDTAAAQCIVEAAGGRVTDLGLAPLRYNTKDSLLNPDFLVVGDPGYDWAAITAGLVGAQR